MPGNYVPAIVAAQQGIPLAEQVGNAQSQRRLQATLGSVYLYLEDYPAALPVLQAVLNSGEKAGDQQAMMSLLNALGTLYSKRKNWPQSVHYFARAQQVATAQHDEVNGTINAVNLADVYRLQGDYKRARVHGLRAYHRALTNQDAYSLPFAELLLAQFYQATHQPDSAIVLARQSLKKAQQGKYSGCQPSAS